MVTVDWGADGAPAGAGAPDERAHVGALVRAQADCERAVDLWRAGALAREVGAVGGGEACASLTRVRAGVGEGLGAAFQRFVQLSWARPVGGAGIPFGVLGFALGVWRAA